MRIDGLDNVAIPSVITISPSAEAGFITAAFKEKVANYLVGLGFHEIFTNSITNSAYYDTEELEGSVKMLNNLSAELNVMRPSLLETGLESISYNLNRKAKDLKFFEFGKTYRTTGTGHYTETNHLCLYVTGKTGDDSWKGKADPADLFYLKGVCQQVARQISVENVVFYLAKSSKLGLALQGRVGHRDLLQTGSVSEATLGSFDIRQPVYFADFSWDLLSGLGDHKGIELAELPRQLPVHRDLAMIVSKHLPYEEVEKSISKIKMVKLRQVRLFDIFENEKLGADKKSLAVSLTFLDDEKTLTDKEVDGMTGQIMEVLEKELSAEIRK
jgi:phenylalanyl-tRNA synthetase beta chain